MECEKKSGSVGEMDIESAFRDASLFDDGVNRDMIEAFGRG